MCLVDSLFGYAIDDGCSIASYITFGKTVKYFEKLPSR